MSRPDVSTSAEVATFRDPLPLTGNLGILPDDTPLVLTSTATVSGLGTLFVESAELKIEGTPTFNQVVVSANGTLSGAGDVAIKNLTLSGNIDGARSTQQ